MRPKSAETTGNHSKRALAPIKLALNSACHAVSQLNRDHKPKISVIAGVQLLPALIEQHPDKFALMRDEVPVAFYDTARDAYIAGLDKFADGLFSVQEITARKIHLGWFSHAAYNPSA